jgi:hypothetical protein
MKISFPGQNIPIQDDNGIDPLWYDRIKALEAFLAMFGTIDWNNITNGYTLTWDATNKRFTMGPN